MWVRSLVQEDPTCLGATKLMRHNFLLSSTTREATEIRGPSTATREQSPLATTRESLCIAQSKQTKII